MKRVGLVVVVVSMLVALVGCSNSGSGDGESGGAKAISYWTFIDPSGTDPRGQALKRNLDLFHEAHPDIAVHVKTIPYAQIDSQVIQGAAVGKGPDVVRISSLVLAQDVDSGALRPIDDYFGSWYKDAENKFIVDPGSLVFDGKQYGVFLENRTSVLQYRADLLKKAGADVPRTLEDVRDAAAKIAASSKAAGFVVGASASGRAAQMTDAIPPLIWSAGGKIINKDGTAAFDSPAGARAFKWLVDMDEATNPDIVPSGAALYSLDQTESAIQAGTVGMTIMGNYRVSGIRSSKKIADVWKTTPTPGFNSEFAPAQVSGWTLQMTQSTRNTDAAWTFIKFMMSDDAQLNVAKGGELPSQASAYDDPWWKTTSQATEQLTWAKYIQQHGRKFSFPKNYSDLSEIWAKALQAMVVNHKPVDQALHNAAQDYDKLLD